jgi:uncharacterized protein YneF (UPF0154 family)
MDTREFSGDFILIVILVLATLLLTSRLWTDLLLIAGAILMMLSLGGLFLLLHIKIRILENDIAKHERLTKQELEEISVKMSQKYDISIAHIDGVVESLGKKIYR